MAIPGMDAEVLGARVRTLEGEIRRWRVITLVAFALVVVTFAHELLAQGRQAQTAPVPAVEAQQFVLKDAKGSVRGQLSVKDSGPSLDLYDESGKVVWSTSAMVRQAR